MIDKEKAKMNMKKQWIKFGVVTALYLLFLLWVKSWLGLIIVPFIFDNYITKKFVGPGGKTPRVPCASS